MAEVAVTKQPKQERTEAERWLGPNLGYDPDEHREVELKKTGS